MKQYYGENLLKRYLKRKVKVTLGLVVAFLITGSIGYGADTETDLVPNDDTAKEYTYDNFNGKGYITLSNQNDETRIVNFIGDTYIWSDDTNVNGVLNGEGVITIFAGNTNLQINLDKDKSFKVEAKKMPSGEVSAFCVIHVNQDNYIKINSEDNLNGNIELVASSGKNYSVYGGGIAAEMGGKVELYAQSLKISKGNDIAHKSVGIGTNSNGTIDINLSGSYTSETSTGILGDDDLGYGRGNITVTASDITIATGDVSFTESELNNKPKNHVGRGISNRKAVINLTATNGNISISSERDGVYTTGSDQKVTLNADYGQISINSKRKAAVTSENSSVTALNGDSSNITGNLYAKNSGKINLNTSDNTITGDILAENNGIVTVENKNNIKGNVFDNRIGDKTSGTVKLNLDNGTWESIGKGSVTEVNLTNSGNIKFIDKSSSIDIENLKGNGNGTFAMTVNSENKSEGNMIYVQNSEGGTYQISLQDSDLSKIKAGDKIRFATIGKDAKDKNLEFEVLDVKEKGIKDVSFTVGFEEFTKGDTSNTEYNDGTNKSGNDYVEKNYENGENWYLTRNEDTSTPDPENPDKPNPNPDENINDIGKTIIEMARANYASAVYMDNLNKRLGDMTFAEGNSGIWVRMRNDRVGEDNEYRLRNNMTQIGYDKTYNIENGKEYRGIAFDYADGQMEYKNIKGEADIDRYTATLYDTRIFDNGFYSDYTAKIGYMESEFDIRGRETGNQAKGDYDNLILGVGAEFGKRYNFGETSYFEPQVQLQYTYIDDADYTTNQDTKVNYEEIHSLIGRAGIRVGHDFYKENSKDNTIYLKLDINHEFLGDQDIKAQDLTGTLNKTYHNDDTWYDVGVGGAKNLTEDLYVYADIERQFGHKDNSWQFNLGFRYKFGSLEDFTFNTANLFDFDKSEVKAEGKEMIKNASEIINKKKVKSTLVIEGHTDWTGSEEYNQLLSEKRARAVEKVFKENVTNENIKYETKGYGETRPVADNKTSEGRARNRRVDINFNK